MKATIHTESTNQTPAAPGMTNSLDIVDEMADRDRRRCNLVAYNFGESDEIERKILSHSRVCARMFLN